MLTLIFTLADATHKFKSPIKFSPQIFDVAGLPLPRPGCTSRVVVRNIGVSPEECLEYLQV